jgi:hypothetical protein
MVDYRTVEGGQTFEELIWPPKKELLDQFDYFFKKQISERLKLKVQLD